MTREQFYTSKEWRTLVQVLRQERTNENGLIICEICGKPILKKYDCIAHHKRELNEQNVNDAAIALNPDNVALIHFGCHNAVHQRGQAKKRKVYLIYGSPKSGKSTFVNENAEPDDLILDIERLWEAVCNGKKPDSLKGNVFGLRDAIIDQIRTRKGFWGTAFIIGGYPLKSDRERLKNLLNAEEIFIDTPKDECLGRCESDEERRYVEKWWESYTE